MTKKFLGIFAAAGLLAACAAESNVPVSVELTSGISEERLALIAGKLQAEVDDGIRSGFVVMINHDGETVHESAVGLADIQNNVPMSQETQFRIASMTKPVTTLAIMMLVERGDLLLSDPVANYIPSFSEIQVATSPDYSESGTLSTEPVRVPMTIHHLLTHTAGLGYIFDVSNDLGKEMIANSLYTKEGDLAARIDMLAQFPLYSQPGTEWRYSYATDVAGRIVEVVSGKPLQDFFQEEIFDPLGMNDTGFYLENPDFSRLANVYIYNEQGEMVLPGRRGNNPDPNADNPGWASGGGGLVSTAPDYMRFAQMLLNEGELDGTRIVSPATVRLMLSRHVSDEVLGRGFLRPGETFGLGGRVVVEPGLAGQVQTKGEFGWGGYFDTGFLISPADDLAIVMMAQREPGPYAPESRARQIVKAVAYGALE